ncbi:corrinoid protein [Clostridium ljungdahlii]|uniref:Methionine synthase n=1 Tax=Clostridium ljungdahlii TaxID=1538 RepID=A0A162L9E7_9CLOT|nr:corrinoid protein [Clostridium ljungdahlii]OAA90516.1 Methionine synthase [Clostridium ljungdahlii]
MSINKDELYKKLADSVVNMDEEEAVNISNQVVSEKLDAYEAIDKGLSAGMDEAGKLFEEEEYFVPELLLCSDAMYAGLDVLKPHIETKNQGIKHKIVIGVVEGDTHDIGKNLVKIMLETAGFDIVDLGRDVPPSTFVERAKEEKAEIIALSTLMTTTMEGMNEVIDILNKENIRKDFKVIIGGGPISQGYADKIGADGYSINAAEAVTLAKKLVEA